MSEAIDPTAGKYDVARCPLPDCGLNLHISWTTGNELYLSFTAEDLAEPGGDGTWQVECEAGHVVLVPIDDGTGENVFGRCKCEPDATEQDRAHAFCEHRDIERLRDVLALATESKP